MSNTIGDEIREWKDHLTDYFTAQTELYKLRAVDKMSVIFTKIITKLIVLYFLLLVLLFASFALAFFLGDLFQSNSLGFICVSGIYLLLIFVFLLLFQRQLVEKKVVKAFLFLLFDNPNNHDGPN